MGSVLALPIAIGVSLVIWKTTNIMAWYKRMSSYAYVKWHMKHTKSRFDLYDMDAYQDPYKIGLLPPEEEKILESPQDDMHLTQASDEVIFYGVNSSSECFMARISRICQNEAEVSLYMKLKSGKSYKLEKTLYHHQTTESSKKIFTANGLKMYYTEPMRKWRIIFKGLLQEVSVDDEFPSKMVYVKFGLQWRASTDPFDTMSDISCSDLAKVLSKHEQNGFLPELSKFYEALNSYYQGGVIRGQVHVDGIPEDIDLYLFGEKLRFLGTAPSMEGYKFLHILGHIAKDGRIVHISDIHIPNMIERLTFGFVVDPDGKVEAATNFSLKETDVLNNVPTNLNFRTNECGFKLNIDISEEKLSYEFGKKDECQFTMSNIALELNSRPGRGIIIKGCVSKPQKRTILNTSTNISSTLKDSPLTVDFLDDICQIPGLTGGKGSSLGKLMHISKNYHNFTVPKGIVVTTSAYEKFITDDILKEVNNLADVVYCNTPGDVKEACNRTIETVVCADFPKALLDSITESLTKVFGDDAFHKMFAVRSSATGEDSEDMSAAGQMETYLGVKTLEQVVLCVKKCWASQFSFIAVQYKKQNGQPLNLSMAVVIQEMVMCDVAGVLFTCDPVSGNPTVMTITANYGLGESVVSASEEPDTINLERNTDDSLKIKDKIIGAKKHQIVIKGEGGTVQEEIADLKRVSFALSDELSLRLGDIAIHIEKNYGSERDIEWGLLNDKFYIFQCRPVTTSNEMSDYEIDHENDAPMRVENEFFTVCNLGEVLPGATSTLGISVFISLFNAMFARKELKMFREFSPKYCPKGLVTMYNHGMSIAADLFEHMNEGEDMMKSMMLSFFGRVIDNEEILELARERYQNRKKMPLALKLRHASKCIFGVATVVKKAKEKYENTGISLDNYHTSNDLFHALIHECTYANDAIMCHLIGTNKSTMGTMLLLSTIQKAKGEIDTDVYNDLSELLSSISEVESADVPSALESLAHQIAKDISPTEFQKMSVEDAEKWLLTTTLNSGQTFSTFLKKHGHRCLREFDVRTPTWAENSKPLIKTLQNLAGSMPKDIPDKKPKTFEEIASRLKTPINTKTRISLKYFLLPLSRSGVQVREASKSVLIRAINEWRKGYRKLSRLMVSEGRLPDEDLLYFMTLLEIQELLKTRSPKIIAKAVHRRRRYPLLDNYIFPELAPGIPKPINTDNSEVTNSDENLSMKGIPVSQGIAKGFARVALTLDEASLLKPGEILLTYSTDIGWTPYFPVLAGIGTELGGLISHGAVVSREYGLPCIAGLHGATQQFKTGDYILLDGNKGILKKLPLPD